MGLSSVPPVGTIVTYTSKHQSYDIVRYGVVFTRETHKWVPNVPHLWANWSYNLIDFQKKDFGWINLACPTLQIFKQEEDILWD